jgi:putative xylitol transport system substrate-binding protein
MYNISHGSDLDLKQDRSSKHHGELNGIIGQNDEMALGAIEANKAANLNVKSFAITCIDGVTDALKAVKSCPSTTKFRGPFSQGTTSTIY